MSHQNDAKNEHAKSNPRYGVVDVETANFIWFGDSLDEAEELTEKHPGLEVLDFDEVFKDLKEVE